MKNNKILCMLGLVGIVLLLCCVKTYNNVERFEEEDSDGPNLTWIIPTVFCGAIFFTLVFLYWDNIKSFFRSIGRGDIRN